MYVTDILRPCYTVKLLFKVSFTDNIFWNIPEVFRNTAFVFIAWTWELEVIFALFRSKSHNRTVKASTIHSWLVVCFRRDWYWSFLGPDVTDGLFPERAITAKLMSDLHHSCNYRVRHKSVNTRVWHKSVNTPLSHERLVVRTWLAVYTLPPTTIYCEPGAYDKPFVG